MKSSEIKNFGILGYPVGHSLSPQMYKAAFKAAGFVNYNYIPLEVHAGKLFMAVEAIKGLDFRGVNVTIPHKMTITRYLDAIDSDAMVIGAVNTVINDGGMLTGYNTDVSGFLAALAEANFLPEDCHAVIWVRAERLVPFCGAYARDEPSSSQSVHAIRRRQTLWRTTFYLTEMLKVSIGIRTNLRKCFRRQIF